MVPRVLAESSVVCPTCGLSVPAGVAACPRDETPLDGEGAWGEPTRPRMRLPGPASTLELAGTPPRPPQALDASGAAPLDRPQSVTLQRDPMIGMQLGEYEVEELIGVGGMGLVYRGVQPVIGKPVAIKVLRPEISDSATHVERLLAEARAVNAVRHRGIIDIFSFGRLPDGRQYFVMEYLQGQALDEYIVDNGPIPPAEALVYLQEIASALHAAHQAGVVHRDLKPNNIFLVKQHGGRYVKLLDFGLAKQGAATQGVTPQTRTGLVVGTPEYIAPEQARGEPVGPCTDLYALGVVAFQMVTGQLPFHGATAMDFVIAHLQEAPPAARDLVPDVPDALSELISQLMAKPIDERPSSADVVRRELKRIARLVPHEPTFVGAAPEPLPAKASPSFSRPVPSRPPSLKPPVPSPPPESLTTAMARTFDSQSLRRPVAPWIAAAVALAVGAGAAAFFLGRGSSREPARVVTAVPATDVATPPAAIAPPPANTQPAAQPAVAATELDAAPADEPAAPVVELASARADAPKAERTLRARARPPTATVSAAPSEQVVDPLAQQRFKALARVDWVRQQFDVRPRPGVSISRARVVLSRAESLAREAKSDADLAKVFEQLRTAEEFLLAPQ